MRGRPNDPVRAKEKARAHARRPYYCNCGRLVFGNGGKAAHAGKHRRIGDGHRWIGRAEWTALFPATVETKEG